MTTPIRVAVLGAGIFAREKHLPAVLATRGSLQLTAVYSHTKNSVLQFVKDAAGLGHKGTLGEFYDIEDGKPVANKGLDALLASDVAAVIIALPILTQPDVIRKCLKAGKHVLCEKPIAKNVVEAEKLVQDYLEIRKTNPKLIFSIAENWRYEPALLKAAEAVKTEQIGKLRLFSLTMNTEVNPDNKYYNTAWRKDPEYQGGFLLDGGVHYAAAIRLLVGGTLIDSITSFSRLNKDILAPIDTVNAAIRLTDGTTGTFTASFASPLPTKDITLIGSKGSIVIKGIDTNYKVTITVDGKSDEKVIPHDGVNAEVKAFGNAIINGKAEILASPVEALIDVALIETIINAAEQGKVLKFPNFDHLNF